MGLVEDAGGLDSGGEKSLKQTKKEPFLMKAV